MMLSNSKMNMLNNVIFSVDADYYMFYGWWNHATNTYFTWRKHDIIVRTHFGI